MTLALNKTTPALSSLIGEFYGEGSAEQNQAMSREVLTQLFVDRSRGIRQKAIDAGLPLLEIEGAPLSLRIQAIVVSYFRFDLELGYLKTIENPTDPLHIEALKDRFVVEDLCRKTASAFNRNMQRVLVCRVQDDSYISFDPLRSPFSMLTTSTNKEDIPRDQKRALKLWKNQEELRLWGMPCTDLELEQLLVCKKLKRLGLFNCPNLFTLRHLSSLTALEALTLKLQQLKNEPQTSNFDLAALNLPRLQILSITWPAKLSVVDARKCLSLTRIIIDIEMQWYTDQSVPFTAKVLDIRGLKCTVSLYPSSETARTLREKELVSSIKILRDAPETQSGPAATPSIPAGLSLS